MISRFLDYLQLERNYSLKTVGSYREDLLDFERYYKGLDQSMTWETIDADIVRGWIEQMMDRGNTASSVNRRLSALRSFYKYLLRNDLVEKDPVARIQGPKKQKPLPQFIKEAEMNQLLQDEMWNDTYESLLEHAIIVMFYETGVRLSELCGLNLGDVNFEACSVKVTGKRNKQRMIPFGDGLKQTLVNYLKVRQERVGEESKAFFVSERGKRLSGEKVRDFVKKNLSRVSTLKKRSPHVLRHSFATAMLNHGASIESVKKLLGHESVATTEIYTHTTFEQLKRVYKEALPRV